MGFPIKEITAEVQVASPTTVEKENNVTPADQQKPTGDNTGLIVLAVLLPIFLIFVGSILLTKYVLRKKANKCMVAVQPTEEHQETNKMIEVDYEKMGVK